MEINIIIQDPIFLLKFKIPSSESNNKFSLAFMTRFAFWANNWFHLWLLHWQFCNSGIA